MSDTLRQMAEKLYSGDAGAVAELTRKALDEGLMLAEVLIGTSALLTTTMPAMKHTIEALEEAGVRESVKVMIGGARVTQASTATKSAPTAMPPMQPRR